MDDGARLENRERFIVETIFKIGLTISISLMSLGLILGGINGGTSGNVNLSHLGDMPLSAALMAVGIVILAAIPALNVLALMIFWASRQRVRLTLIALAVVATLSTAVLLGRA
jgi:hypothetical protein